jgi:hypothetical protein
MRQKSKELLELVKRSKGKNKIGIEHVRELVDDIKALGADQFLVEAVQIMNSSRRGGGSKKPTDPLALSLEGLQMRAGLDRKTFLGYVVKQLELENSGLKPLPKKQHTLPAVINYYKPHLGADRLESIALKVVQNHSQAH